MCDKLFLHTIQYIESLYDEGFLSQEKIKKLADFSLELGNVNTTVRNTLKSPVPRRFIQPDETNEILSDIFVDKKYDY